MTVHTRQPTLDNRAAFYAGHKFILGLFGANCSSGRAVTLVPERWTGSWRDCFRWDSLARYLGY